MHAVRARRQGPLRMARPGDAKVVSALSVGANAKHGPMQRRLQRGKQ